MCISNCFKKFKTHLGLGLVLTSDGTMHKIKGLIFLDKTHNETSMIKFVTRAKIQTPIMQVPSDQ